MKCQTESRTTVFCITVFDLVLIPTSHCDIMLSDSCCFFFLSALSAPLCLRLWSDYLPSKIVTTPLCLLSAERFPRPPREEEGGLTAETPTQCEVSIAGEMLEDMSLSSNSSLDKNDTSQEYMDDFDNLGKRTDTSLTLRSIGAFYCKFKCLLGGNKSQCSSIPTCQHLNDC